MCLARISEQQLFSSTTLADWFCITEVKSVYSAVRTESYKTDTLIFKGLTLTAVKRDRTGSNAELLW